MLPVAASQGSPRLVSSVGGEQRGLHSSRHKTLTVNVPLPLPLPGEAQKLGDAFRRKLRTLVSDKFGFAVVRFPTETVWKGCTDV